MGCQPRCHCYARSSVVVRRDRVILYKMMYISIINNLQLHHDMMTEERLSGLAQLYIHRDTHFIPSPEDIYSKKANWRHIREN